MKGEIVSSTGELKVSRRTYGRVVVNPKEISTDPAQFDRNIRRLFAIPERHTQISRPLFRGVVTQAVFDHVRSNDLRQHMEVHLPLNTFTGDTNDGHLIYMAKNAPGREQLVTTEAMHLATERLVEGHELPENERTSPEKIINDIAQKGHLFINTIENEDQADQLYALWGPTFEWTRGQIDVFRSRLESAGKQEKGERKVWFSAILDKNIITSAAMAERLPIPATTTTGWVDLVESTEWKTREGYERQGFLKGVIAMLNAQILSDLADNPNGLPIIYPECNFETRAEIAGYGVGFRIPRRDYARQILAQNVEVQKKLSDFTFAYLPPEIIKRDYSHDQRHAMISTLKR